jgi:hypothetical protein
MKTRKVLQGKVAAGKKSAGLRRTNLDEDHYWHKALKPIPRPGDARYEYLQKKHG